jgi:pyruvate/2-oxoglutarate dehydrogenase complex dihydrolipoamide acyltransferase (E2) component
LANLGIETGELKATEFVRSQEVAAIVVEPRGARRRAYAPVAGVVRRVVVRPGSTVAAGEPIAELLRDPFPRPVLTLTDSLLRGLDEDFHHTVSELRTTALALELARSELERVRKAISASGTAGIFPTRTEIDLQREVQRTERGLQNAREESRRHGLMAAEVAAIEAGTLEAPPAPDIHRVLDARKLWSPAAERVFALTPGGLAGRAVRRGARRQLSAASLLSPELEEALRQPHDRRRPSSA